MTKEPEPKSLNDYFSGIILRAMLVGIGSSSLLFGGILLLLGHTPGGWVMVGGVLLVVLSVVSLPQT
jgi:hypothetical protein